MLVSEIIKITKGKLISGDPSADIDLAAISSDSRTIGPDNFFLPLKGKNFDGEKFIEESLEKGAMGAFVTTAGTPPKGGGAGKGLDNIIIQVEDTTKALQDVAHGHRMKFDIPVIGVTGSNGKTTVKDMMAKMLSSKYNVLKNEGTKNNHIGLPQTLLKLNKTHEFCILEMGTNHKGEISSLADIARPDIAVITNIGPSHLEFLKDLKGVFESKKEIFEFLGKDSIAILNGDDEFLSGVKNDKFKIIRFGLNKGNEVKGSVVSTQKSRIDFLVNDDMPFVLNLAGVHNVYNALAAIAVANHFGIDKDCMKKELAEYIPTYMRLNIKDIDGLVIIDDAYNSNPLSMRAALETARSYPAKARWIVSADMLELGEKEDYFHRMIGEAVAKGGFDGLITFGKLSKTTSSAALESGMIKDRVWHCSDHEEIASILHKVAKAGDCILVKGSRAMKMEEVVEKLKGHRVVGS